MKYTSNGIPVVELDAIGSTNTEAFRLGLAGSATPLWVRADRQTSGRGRSGRVWTSEPGNHAATLLVRLTCDPKVLHQLSFVAAIAVVSAIRDVASAHVPAAPALPMRLKWPNDILLDGAKLVGILAESTLLPDKGVLAVIGIGINLAHAPALADRPTTCLASHGIAVQPWTMLDALSTSLAAMLALWNCGAGFTTIRDRWLVDALPIGTSMTVHTGMSAHAGSAANRGRDTITGTFGGLDGDGALILRDHSGYDQRLSFGDVTVNAAQGGQGQKN